MIIVRHVSLVKPYDKLPAFRIYFDIRQGSSNCRFVILRSKLTQKYQFQELGALFSHEVAGQAVYVVCG